MATGQSSNLSMTLDQVLLQGLEIVLRRHVGIVIGSGEKHLIAPDRCAKALERCKRRRRRRLAIDRVHERATPGTVPADQEQYLVFIDHPGLKGDSARSHRRQAAI